ncbi:hypothetical protein HK100_011378 [Physocladia obscura]|uniref:Uncharacterized protein n=1 Tax=Physocladia obscura TaxID=109957 RepID=A0AAD5T485_9FUNG|nr:hypothetical protein HK100_011378 [Physocladia obscura]
MRDGRLSPSARALVLKSCGAILKSPLSESTKKATPTETAAAATANATTVEIPENPKENDIDSTPYLPTNSDSTLFLSHNLPSTYSPQPSSPLSYRRRNNSHTISESGTDMVIDEAVGQDPRDSKMNNEIHENSRAHNWTHSFAHIDCEWTMRTMDTLFTASFVDFIKSEKNCEFNGRHIAMLVKDYKLDQVVHGLSWLIAGWSIESTARVLKNVFDDWLPELAAFAVAKIGADWPLRPKMGLVVAFMMMGEAPNVAALFIRSLTIGWDSNLILELITCLEFLLNELSEASRAGEITEVEPKQIIHALASMYKATSTMTNHRILMADFRLAVAKSHYLTQFAHSLACNACIHHRSCTFSSRTEPPQPACIIAATRNRHEPTTATNASSDRFRSLITQIPHSLREFFTDEASASPAFGHEGVANRSAGLSAFSRSGSSSNESNEHNGWSTAPSSISSDDASTIHQISSSASRTPHSFFSSSSSLRENSSFLHQPITSAADTNVTTIPSLVFATANPASRNPSSDNVYTTGPDGGTSAMMLVTLSSLDLVTGEEGGFGIDSIAETGIINSDGASGGVMGVGMRRGPVGMFGGGDIFLGRMGGLHIQRGDSVHSLKSNVD